MTTDPPPAPDDRRPPGRFRWPFWLVLAAGLAAVWSLALPAFQQERRSRSSPFQSRLKHLGLGVHNFHSTYKSFPPWTGETTIYGPGAPVPSWQTALLPYLDEGDLWRAYDGTRAYDDPANAAVVRAEVGAYLSPHADWADRGAEGGFGLSHYAGNVAVLGPEGPRGLDEIPDGAANTLLIGEIGGFPAPWADPANLRDAAAGFGRGPRQFGGPHAHGGVVVMGDGSVSFISEEIDPALFAALGTPDGGEDIDDDF